MNKGFIAALLILCLFAGACAGRKAPDPSMDASEDDFLIYSGRSLRRGEGTYPGHPFRHAHLYKIAPQLH